MDLRDDAGYKMRVTQARQPTPVSPTRNHPSKEGTKHDDSIPGSPPWEGWPQAGVGNISPAISQGSAGFALPGVARQSLATAA
jgi:hypothetical protein